MAVSVYLRRSIPAAEANCREPTELEQTNDAGAPFSAAGDRTYGYEVELPDGTVLTASTGSAASGLPESGDRLPHS